MKNAYDFHKWRNICGGTGILAIFGLICYEKYKIDKFLARLIDKDVLEIDKKRPDYIYIKYHIYRESMRKLQLRQMEDANWINIIINPIGKWWKSFKHSVAWRLLNVAQGSKDKADRLLAVRQLSNIDHLKDWDFRHLAQICDARTAVSLARSGCDSRWFVPVRMNGVIKNPKIVIIDLHKLLDHMQPNDCIKNFFNKYFTTVENKNSDTEEYFPRGHNLSTHDINVMKECIAFLHHITKDEAICKQIIKFGGLLTLVELKKIFENDNETLATLCKTLANISLAENCVEDFFASGLITILSQWRYHPDLRLQVIAAKTLANLDYDDIEKHQYPPNVYPLYPRSRNNSIPKADVIFIHGLLGGVFITWRQKDKKPAELGLYGKNAFYTSEVDDVFLVGENKRSSIGRKNGVNKSAIKKESITQVEAPVISTVKKVTNKHSNISDQATKELVEALETSAELESDWEVVYPDCPLKSNMEDKGEFSVTGDKWINDDRTEDYTNCWPMDWLPEDYPNVRIIGIDYTSALTEWSANYAKYCPCEKGHGSIETRSNFLLQRLARANIGKDRPVIWVGHSMGGILCKNMLLKAMVHKDLSIHRVAKNTKGIIFLGTPHRGSSIAKWKQHMQVIISPSIEVKELEENDPKLLKLHQSFMECLRTNYKNLNVVSIAEGEPTMLTTFKFPLRIVTEESAYMNFGDFYVLKDDHLSLSKPIFRQSFLYQRLLKVIESSMCEVEQENYEKEASINFFNIDNYKNLLESFPKILFKLIRQIET